MKVTLLLQATLLASLAVISFGARSVQAQAPAPKVNVLFIAVDDLKPVLGCYGDTMVKSPNIDRLASQGMIFNKAYTMQAVCSPSRNAMLTGLRPQALQIYDLPTHFRLGAPDVVTLPQVFKNNGWQSLAMGKIFHVGAGNYDDKFSWSVPTYSPGETYVLQANLDKRKSGLESDEGSSTKKHAPPTELADVPDNAYSDGLIADRAIENLRAMKQSGTPFFMAVGFRKPHLPFAAPKKYWDMYDRSKFKLADRDRLPDGAPEFAGTNFNELRNYSDMPEVGPVDADKARELIHGYHACVSYMDAQLGRVMDELTTLGLRDNTIIVLWGDHGWHLGDHGLWCKHTNYEQATRTPLIISVPHQTTAGTKSDSVVEFVDVYPTLCELAGVPMPAWLQGTSLKPILDSPAATITNNAAFHVYPRSTKDYGKLLGQTVRTARYRLVEWQKTDGSVAARELYDYNMDPGETVNIAEKPESASIVAELSAMLKEQLSKPMPSGVTIIPPDEREKAEKPKAAAKKAAKGAKGAATRPASQDALRP